MACTGAALALPPKFRFAESAGEARQALYPRLQANPKDCYHPPVF
jgi:hypothetical protein